MSPCGNIDSSGVDHEVAPFRQSDFWIVAWTGSCNLRGDRVVTIGFKTGSRGVESEAIYTMLEVSASKFECECEQ